MNILIRKCLVGFLLVNIFLYSCNNTGDCGLTADRQVRIKFKKLSKNILADTTVSKLFVYVKDSFLYNDETAGLIALELSPSCDSSEFVIQTDSLKDTITFHYSRKLAMVSSDCGFNTLFTYKSLNFTKNQVIDSIKIIHTDINKDVPENIYLILKPHKIKPDTTKTDTTKQKLGLIKINTNIK